MPSASDRSPSAVSSPSPGRNIFSRIASPFSSKSRNIADFSIEPDDPLKQHSPGDLVTGCVRLRVSRPTRVTHVVVCLHGFVQVYKNAGSPGDGFRANSGYVGTGRGKKSGEYFGNGFASLFEDEVVLCGDGRLAEGTYQFNFELEFPDRDLPSSIDFERGTITYMITATMTRPTTISPTISCDRKVYYVERIDISPLYPPKSRTITLEPISRRSRARYQARKLVDSDNKSRKTDAAEQGSDRPRWSEQSSTQSAHADSGTPGSPIPSEISLDSSSHGHTSQPDSQQIVSTIGSEEGQVNASKSSLVNKVITATIESQAGGCLRGDTIPVKVNVFHTKHVKSLYGVIVTLYRQARVDMHPSIPLGPTEKGKDKKVEEYYPKSLTGLGGLSLTGAGSSHIFRKDLAQVMAPLMIDPQTLTAEVNTKVRVPEEAFPTISTVPGAMISFKYYVEVVLDIQGRLSSQDRSLTNLTGLAGLPGHTSNTDGSDMERSAFTPFGSTIVDTAPIRRDKSVVTSTFEVVVGTRDSERRKGKRKLMEAVPEPESSDTQAHGEPYQTQSATSGADWYNDDTYYDPRWYDQQYSYWYPYNYSPSDHYHSANQYQSYDQPPPPPPSSIPHIPDASQMTEKQRIEQAEVRLLPSQPPGMDAERSVESNIAATAPYLPEEGNAQNHLDTAPSYPTAMPDSGSSAPNAVAGEGDRPRQMSVVPKYEPSQAGSSMAAIISTEDDKQEMERQQFQSAASAPPVDNENAGPSYAHEHAPTAPDLVDADGTRQDIHDSHADAFGSSGLPRYER